MLTQTIQEAMEYQREAEAKRVGVPQRDIDFSRRSGIEGELTGLADQHLRSRRDAIERSLAYTADATMRRLHDA